MEVRDERRVDYLVGDSPALVEIFKLVGRVAGRKSTVLISGESGTGKELVARAIHAHSPRRERPLVSINCGALTETLLESELFGHVKGSFTGAIGDKKGLFEAADGGTLFLDEIGETSKAVQVKLLRVLQEEKVRRVGDTRDVPVDVRIIAATNQDLAALIRAGGFREDLYFRLNVVPVTAPALRDRLEDVPLLAERFLGLAVRDNDLRPKPVDPAVTQRLGTYRWPGNVRELRNVCERMAIMSGDRIQLADVPDYVGPRPAAPLPPGGAGDLSRYGEVPLKELRELVERDYILRQLEAHDWNVTQAAQALGVERTNLHKKLKQLGLSRGDRGGEGAE
jgi:DNA-binding NtrC family response regulator